MQTKEGCLAIAVKDVSRKECIRGIGIWIFFGSSYWSIISQIMPAFKIKQNRNRTIFKDEEHSWN